MRARKPSSTPGGEPLSHSLRHEGLKGRQHRDSPRAAHAVPRGIARGHLVILLEGAEAGHDHARVYR